MKENNLIKLSDDIRLIAEGMSLASSYSHRDVDVPPHLKEKGDNARRVYRHQLLRVIKQLMEVFEDENMIETRRTK